MREKNEQIGFRVPSALKQELQRVAKLEARTLSQLCEILVKVGLAGYKKEGPKFFQRFLSRQKKEDLPQ